MVDVLNIISFFCSGRGKGESEAPRGGGVRSLIENPRSGGGGSQGGEGLRGREGVCGELGNFLGGGRLIFFFGAEMSTKFCARKPPERSSCKSFVQEIGENAAKFWRIVSQIFVVRFPGQIAAKNSRKILVFYPQGTK